MSIPRFDEKTDFSQFPHLDMAGKQFVKELEWQMYENTSWSESERAWFGALRNEFLATVIGYEDAVNEAYLKGVEYGQQMIFGMDEDKDERV